jgi:hypothetical protein
MRRRSPKSSNGPNTDRAVEKRGEQQHVPRRARSRHRPAEQGPAFSISATCSTGALIARGIPDATASVAAELGALAF